MKVTHLPAGMTARNGAFIQTITIRKWLASLLLCLNHNGHACKLEYDPDHHIYVCASA